MRNTETWLRLMPRSWCSLVVIVCFHAQGASLCQSERTSLPRGSFPLSASPPQSLSLVAMGPPLPQSVPGPCSVFLGPVRPDPDKNRTKVGYFR